MEQKLGNITFLVRDYDEAIGFFTQALDFKLIEDTVLDEDKRWVRVAPPGTDGSGLLLAKASTPEQTRRIGDQTGGRVAFFLHTDNFWRDHASMLAKGVKFKETPREETYGTVAVFEDLYGNLWDLLELKNP
jgi:catechol 2,3-dioxygenase-like lactoylglutathione lyase family enzyme